MAHWQFHYPKRYAFYPPDYETPGLGGGEAALVLLTRQLALRGHTVEVFNCCYKPGMYEGVRWRSAWELVDSTVPDVAVSVRFDEALWPVNMRAGRHLFWMLDDRTRGPAAFVRQLGERGTIVVASAAMQQRLDLAGVQARIARIPLPVDVRRYKFQADRSLACLFSSMANRGLDVALAIWPRILAELPKAQLWVTSGWQLWGFTNSESEDRWRQILGERPLPDGVRLLGPVPRTELCALQERAWLCLYPCRFPEMFCLAAAECAVAGTPMIASAIDALSERIIHGITGILVSGSIEDPAVQAKFVTETVSLLCDPGRRDMLGAAARRLSSVYELDTVAEQWERLV